MDKIIGKDPTGEPIYLDEKTGEKYIIKPPKAKIADKTKEENSNMSDEAVTKLDLVKRDIGDMKKDLDGKITKREEQDKEILGKVGELDKKICHGEECYVRIEKKQDEMWKILESLKDLASPKFVCRKCHSSSIKKGDRVCPVCGDPVEVVWN